MSKCPDRQDLIAFLVGDEGIGPDVTAHIGECDRCRASLAWLKGTLELAAAYEAFVDGPAPDIPADVAERIFRAVDSAYIASQRGGFVIRPLAVMFTDMADSTEHAEKYGDEEAYAKRLKHNELMIPLIGEHGGTLVESIGDALMVTFDQAADAARCAVAMLRRLHEYNRSLVVERDHQIHVRIGFHWGKAVAYCDGDRLNLVGSAVNVAARVEGGGGKQTDQILLSDAAFAQLLPYQEEFRIEDYGSVTAKGAGLLRLYRLLWQAENAAAAAPLRLAAQTAAELEHRMVEASSTRGIHCLFVDPASGRGYIRPLFVKVLPAEGGLAVHSRVTSDRVMQAAVTRAVRATLGVLSRLGFSEAEAERHAVEWWIEGPAAEYEGASIGLGAALATAAAYAGLPVDRTAVVTGATDGERVVRVAGIGPKWGAIRDLGFKMLILPEEDLSSLPSEARDATEPRLLAVATVEDAIVDVFGPALGLAGRRTFQAISVASQAKESIKIELRIEREEAYHRGTRSVGIRPRRQSFLVGDEIRILMRADRNCHLSLINIGSTGSVSILLPNALRDDTLVIAGQWTTFPKKEDGFSLPLLGPAGVEKIVAIASENPLDLKPDDFHQSGQFAEVTERTIRGIDVVDRIIRHHVLAHAEVEFFVTEVEGERAPHRGTTRAMEEIEPKFRWIDLD